MTETPDTFPDGADGPDQDAIFDNPDETLDAGYSPPESYRGEGFGTTADEAVEGESFDQRVAQEQPDPDPYEQQGEQVGGEVGRERAGRLVDPNEGIGEDTESDLIGDDVGIDGAAASAEEAAVHVVEDDLG